MTSQKEQIQTLVAEIDGVLQRINPRLPWVMSGEVALQRQVLERVRNYLVTLQQQLPGSEGLTALESNSPSRNASTQLPAVGNQEMTPYQMMQAILRDVSYLRSNAAQPAVNQQQLTAELLQILMSRLQENLAQQIAQALDDLRNQPLAYGTHPMLPGGVPIANPQYEQLQTLRSRSDQMLVNLDSSLNIVFESLQRNIQAYQESLTHGLDRMHSLGQQSEFTFKALIEQLSQQLKQEASSALLSSSAATGSSSTPSTSPQTVESFPASPTIVPPSTVIQPQPAAPSQNFPYAGAEFLASEISGSDVTTPAEQPVALDAAIDTWLQSLSAISQQAERSPISESVLDLPTLDLSDLELAQVEPIAQPDISQPNISQPNIAQPKTEPETQAFTGQTTSKTISQTTSQTEDATIDTTAAITAIEVPAIADVSTTAEVADEDAASIDAALKLLEELSAELDDSTASSSADVDAELDQMLNASLTDQTDVALPNDAQDELDEFYQSFEAAAQATLEAETAKATPLEPPQAESLPDSLLETSSFVLPISMDDTSQELKVDLSFLTEDEPATTPAIEATIAPTPETELLFLDLPEDLFGDVSTTGAPATDAPATQAALGTTNPDRATATSPPDEMDSLTDLLGAVKAEELRSVPTNPSIVSGLGMLASSPPSASEPLFLTDDLFGTASAPESGDDQYARAAADENLLPNAPVNEVEFNFELDDFTLNSLSEDLSSLEGFGFNRETGSPISPEFTLDTFASDIEAAPEKRSASDRSTASIEATTPEDAAPDDRVPDDAIGDNATADDAVALADTTASTPFYQASAAIESTTIESTTIADFAQLFDQPTPANSHPIPTQPLPFTLEGDRLFEPDLPPAATTSLTVSNEPSPFTLEGMDDLFGDAPPLSLSALSDTAPPNTTSSNTDASVSNPPADSPVVADQTSSSKLPFTLEGVDELFDAGENNDSQAAAHSNAAYSNAGREIPPFKPEFFVPDTTQPLPSFKLEKLDNLFDEGDANGEWLGTSTPNSESMSSAPASAPNKQSLDAAFESVLGVSPSLPEASSPNIVQKKKQI